MKHFSLFLQWFMAMYCLLLRLRDVARGDPLVIQGHNNESPSSSDTKSLKLRLPHCSHCGHPGNKKSHLKFSCEDCNSTAGQSCCQKPAGFKCSCASCDLVQNHRALHFYPSIFWSFVFPLLNISISFLLWVFLILVCYLMTG